MGCGFAFRFLRVLGSQSGDPKAIIMLMGPAARRDLFMLDINAKQRGPKGELELKQAHDETRLTPDMSVEKRWK